MSSSWASAGFGAGRRGRRLDLAGLTAILVWAGCDRPPPAPADLVLTGGTIVTMDPGVPRAEAIAVRDELIVYVGGAAGVERYVGPRTRVVAIPGRMVLPAFVDAHVHPVTGGLELAACDLAADTTAAAILEHVRACVAALPAGAWLVGSSWALPAFPGAAPRKEWLDRVSGGHPAYFSAADGHSAWVNSAALARAGITRDTPDPAGGRIERRGGEPSGTLRESAMRLVADRVPPPTPAQRRDGLRRAIGLLNRHGVTAIQEAAADRAILETYRDLARRGELTVRVVAAMRADPGRPPAAQVDSFRVWRREFLSQRLQPGAIKLFVDGVIEARTAAMLEPYLDRPGWAGEPNWTPAALEAMVGRAVEAGFAVHLHAIGDRAVRLGLDAIERAEKGRARAGRRHQIAHLEVIAPADVPRFAALDVIATFQPLWGYPDRYVRDLTWPALGEARSAWLYPIGAVSRAGGRLAFGSDWNVSSLVPLEGVEVAVTRRDPADSLGPALLPEQAIDLEQALRAYTIGSAYALGLDRVIGSLAAGHAADLVVLDRDLLRMPSGAGIGRVRVLATFLAGRPVFGNLDSLGAP